MSEHPNPAGSGRDGLRASDDDREQLVSELNEHSVAGRLSTEDLEERSHAAYSAQTLGELDALRRDLPSTPRTAMVNASARRAHSRGG